MRKKVIIIVLATVATFMLAMAVIGAARIGRSPDFSTGIGSSSRSDTGYAGKLDLIKMQWKTNRDVRQSKAKKFTPLERHGETVVNSGINAYSD